MRYKYMLRASMYVAASSAGLIRDLLQVWYQSSRLGIKLGRVVVGFSEYYSWVRDYLESSID